MSKPANRPWSRIGRRIVTPETVIAEFLNESECSIAVNAVNAWDDPLALEARIGELMRQRYPGTQNDAADAVAFALTPLERTIQYTNEIHPITEEPNG